jgi:DNA-directed RNA polymerase specialized sigma24 family protein
MSADLEFEKLVKLYYRDLYRFGLSLTGSEADACDLTQETFYVWASQSAFSRAGARNRRERRGARYDLLHCL